MSTYIICITDDLAGDVKLYSSHINAMIINEAGLSTLQDNDTLVIYGHGEWSNVGGIARATNKIIWGTKAINGTKTCDKLIESDFPVGRTNITIVVHCCFSAGTIENPPTQVESQSTFAGQLCSALKAYYFPGLRVIGYQGQTKAGKAGFAAGQTANAPRVLRGQQDPNLADLWALTYGGPGDRDVLLASGARASFS
ncbi:hypothetical protein [Acidiphilium sp. JA12-A1]|uniref:hypothetical protein n=1 Tax=Acidiphilium sp. JA12-A1 TaxID=1464546 RepID=UPI0019679B96|nr:hypothetical protein [Acidiphilium sp. JA12-A1]